MSNSPVSLVPASDARFAGRLPFAGIESDAGIERSERLPADTEEQFRMLAENLPQMIFTCDSKGKKTYCSAKYLEYVGASCFTELNELWRNVVHPEDRSRAVERWFKALESGIPYTVEYRLRRHDGVYRHHLAHAVPARDDSGEIRMWVGTITDIDDQKRTEEVLRRTDKLAAAGRMAAALAHEINNPLASVTNALYLALQDQALHPDTRQYLKLADQELSRVARVASNSLRFHKQSSAAKPVDLAQVMNAVLATYAPRLYACGITVDCDLRTHERLYCRIDDMRQVFAHLVSNSLDAMAQGGRLRVRIRLCRSKSKSGAAGIRVVVADTGHGIPAALLPRVLEAFTTTKEPAGIGLGLWVADDIVCRHNGSIAIRSRTTGPTRGTVVALFFPFVGVAD